MINLQFGIGQITTYLIILAIFISIGMMLGANRGLKLPLLLFVIGIFYSIFIDTSTNLNEHILTPAYETILGLRPLTVYNFSSVLFLAGLGTVLFSASYNAYISFGRDGLFRLFRK
jgi:hypothetical protein